MREILEGVFAVRDSEIPKGAMFVRQDPIDGKIQPLLHVCVRDEDPASKSSDRTVLLYTDTVRWDYHYGHYTCNGCKKTWKAAVNLAKIWEDGHGTGQEGLA